MHASTFVQLCYFQLLERDYHHCKEWGVGVMGEGGRKLGRFHPTNLRVLLTNFCPPLNSRPVLLESDWKLVEVLPASKST